MTILSARLLQLVGAVVALVGVAGFWLSRDVPRNLLDEGQQAVLNVLPGEFRASFVVAGGDYDHAREAGALPFVGGRCVRSRPGEFVVSRRTDTILFVSIIGSRVQLASIPRDIYLPEWQTRINARYLLKGAEGLKRSVSAVLGLAVDYFIADFFGGRARTLAELPDAPLLITNRSGVPGLEYFIKERLVCRGVPEERLLLREADLDPAPTRVLAATERWQDARYYAELFHAGQQRANRLPMIGEVGPEMELILGTDAQVLAGAMLLAREGGYDRN